MILKGSLAVVSGGSRGIGLGIAQAFASKGASVVLLGRSSETLQAALGTLSTSQSQQHTVHEIDVSKAEAWHNLSKTTNCPDILVNAAGITQYSLLPRTPIHTIDSVVATNLLGTIYGSQTMSKAMLANKKPGCIINVSSALAHRGGSGSTVYAASKAGIIGFTKALSAELSPRGIRSVAIAPGYIDTAMTSGMAQSHLANTGMSEDMKANVIQQTGLRRTGSVDEVAQAAVFIVENNFINGTTITLDGGLTYE